MSLTEADSECLQLVDKKKNSIQSIPPHCILSVSFALLWCHGNLDSTATALNFRGNFMLSSPNLYRNYVCLCTLRHISLREVCVYLAIGPNVISLQFPPPRCLTQAQMGSRKPMNVMSHGPSHRLLQAELCSFKGLLHLSLLSRLSALLYISLSSLISYTVTERNIKNKYLQEMS